MTLAGFSLLVVRPGSPSTGPGNLVAREDVVLWKSPRDQEGRSASQVEARFELENHGSTPVRILTIKAGCGCTSPRVEPSLVPPGGTALVSVSALLPIGDKTVPITLTTDSPLTPSVVLALRMIGNRPPPFLLQVVGDLSYLGDKSTAESREIVAVTIEGARPTKRPELMTDLAGLKFEEVGIEEAPYTVSKAVQRKYRYRAYFEEPTPGSAFRGVVRVSDPWNPGQFELIQVEAKSEPEYRVVPATLDLKVGNEKSASRFGADFLVFIKEPAPDLTVVPEGENAAAWVVTRVEGPSNDRFRAFHVQSAEGATVSGDRLSLAIRRAPGSPTIERIAARIRRDQP